MALSLGGPSSAAMEQAESDWEKLLALASTAVAPRSLPASSHSAPQRVVSLLGAATETIYRLGRGDLLVGRSHECDWPPSVLRLPMVSTAKVDTEADSRAIDAAVRSFADRREPVYAVKVNMLERLRPDLVIVQDHCRVCAVTPDELSGSCTRQLVLKPSTLADCLADVETVGEALGERERGVALRELLQARLDAVRATVRKVAIDPTVGAKRRRVAVLEWFAPLMGCGYWIPELIEAAGGEPVLSAPAGEKTPSFTSVEEVRGPPASLHWPRGTAALKRPSFSSPLARALARPHAALSPTRTRRRWRHSWRRPWKQPLLPPPSPRHRRARPPQVLAAKPDVVIFALCGFDIARAGRELAASCGGGGSGGGDGDGDGALDRLRHAGIDLFVMDGNGLVNRSGPRLVESLEAIVEAVQPTLRGWFGHLGTPYLSTLEDALPHR